MYQHHVLSIRNTLRTQSLRSSILYCVIATLKKQVQYLRKNIQTDLNCSISLHWRKCKIRVLYVAISSASFASLHYVVRKWLYLHFDRMLWSFSCFFRKKQRISLFYLFTIQTLTMLSRVHNHLSSFWKSFFSRYTCSQVLFHPKFHIERVLTHSALIVQFKQKTYVWSIWGKKLSIVSKNFQR